MPEAQPGEAAADRQAAQHQPGSTIAITGCVEAAPGTNQFVLRHVRHAPADGVDPQRDTTTAGPHGITERSWVRLDGGDRAGELRKFAGHRVTLTGTLADSGENTIGTAGASGSRAIGGEASRAAGDEHYSDRVKDEAGRIARESMADGTAATVRVTAVESTNEQCPADSRPQVR